MLCNIMARFMLHLHSGPAATTIPTFEPRGALRPLQSNNFVPNANAGGGGGTLLVKAAKQAPTRFIGHPPPVCVGKENSGAAVGGMALGSMSQSQHNAVPRLGPSGLAYVTILPPSGTPARKALSLPEGTSGTIAPGQVALPSPFKHYR